MYHIPHRSRMVLLLKSYGTPIVRRPQPRVCSQTNFWESWMPCLRTIPWRLFRLLSWLDWVRFLNYWDAPCGGIVVISRLTRSDPKYNINCNQPNSAMTMGAKTSSGARRIALYCSSLKAYIRIFHARSRCWILFFTAIRLFSFLSKSGCPPNVP